MQQCISCSLYPSVHARLNHMSSCKWAFQTYSMHLIPETLKHLNFIGSILWVTADRVRFNLWFFVIRLEIMLAWGSLQSCLQVQNVSLAAIYFAIQELLLGFWRMEMTESRSFQSDIFSVNFTTNGKLHNQCNITKVRFIEWKKAITIKRT